MTETPVWAAADWIARTQLILDSYARWTGRELQSRVGDPAEQSRRLFEADFVVVAHGTEADPILCYGNRKALELWEMDLAAFLQTPSRKTAEPVHRDERREMLERTARDGYFDDYQGVRISSTGRRFLIRKAIVWNLVDADGQPAGQAASFADWQPLEANRGLS
ncbi:MEKHLA domain protein [Maioricimonas rarisocia]|uniref:MEKHLA domain protein n=1 Tax=Maioricimonas rarisocia TaxID=2528026 RepID=A0A517Z458_9PLAN|nr:MEKHLA domain-containing protein [Maioricimonas rarisocia]QDU37249.1 MEKHLA domain protein [Maioricimonas rarisocia]